MANYDGSLKFDTGIDTSGFKSGVNKLKGLAVASGTAIAGGLGVAIKKGMDFEAQMSTVGSISLATAEDMEILSKKAKEMGIKTVFSATQAGEAMEYMAMAGWKTADMTNGIEGIMNLAAASGENLATTSDIVTDALTAFGLAASDSGRLADVMAAASSNANTNVALMGETFKYVAPVAGALGYSIEDTSKAIGLMANAGIKGSQAGTALRSIMSRMSKPTKETSTAMSVLGLSLTDSQGNMKSLNQIMVDLRKGMSSLTKDEKAAYAAMLGGQEAMSGLLAIASASEDDFNKLGTAIENSAGSAKKMSEIKLDNLKGQLTLMGSAAEGLGIAIYEGLEEPLTEAVKNGSGMISELADEFTSGELKESLNSIGEFVGGTFTTILDVAQTALPIAADGIQVLAANATPLSAIFIGATTTILTYKTAVGVATTATSLFSAATTFLTNPLGLATLAIGAGAAAFVGIKMASENARKEFFNMGDTLDATSAKFAEAKEKANVTEDYAARWRDLNAAISGGTLSGEQLKNAEAERKEIEKWFIENYGQYISAEEQKNGIRGESISAISEQVRLLSEQQRLELENQALEMQREIPDLTQSIADLQTQNKEMDAQNIKLLTANNTVLKAQQEWQKFLQTKHTAAEEEAKYQEILEICNKALGKNCNHMAAVDAELQNNNKTIQENTDKIASNTTEIDDGTASLQSYADTSRQLIELELGDSLQTFADKMSAVKAAQEELNSSGTLSKDTYNKLVEIFPDLAESLGNSETASFALSEKMSDLETKLGNAQTKAADLGTDLNGLPKDITIDVKLNVPEVPKFARGTSGARKGPAIVNDGNGPELIQDKSGAFRMVGSKGAALTWLNNGDKVYTAEQTKAMLKGIPHYADGIGNNSSDVVQIKITSYIDKIPKAFEKAYDELQLQRDMDVISEADYYSSLEKLRDEYFKSGSDKWWEYTKEIKDYQKNNAFSQLEKQLKRGIITETEYYSQLAALRDEYFVEGSAEWESYTDKIYEYNLSQANKARDKEFSDLDKRLSRRLISESEYYDELEKLRDKHFAEGSDEWQDYTDRIVDYNISQINNIVDSIKAKSDSIKSNLLSGLTTIYSSTITFKKDPNAPVAVAGRNPQGDYSGADYTQTVFNLQDLKAYRKGMQRYSETIKKLADTENLSAEFYDYLLSLDMTQGYGLASTLLNMSESERKGFLKDWDDVQALSSHKAEELSKGIADKLYTEDVKELVTESADELSEDFIAELGKYFSSIPEEYYNVGSNAAQKFADGFGDTIQAALASANSSYMNMIGGNSVHNTYTDSRSTVIYAGNNASAHEIIENLNQQEIYQSHTKGWS